MCPSKTAGHHAGNSWGYISYLDYRHKTEFGENEYQQIDLYCKERNVIWFASAWDELSVDFIAAFDPACIKIPSAALTDHDLLLSARKHKVPLILSTGMSTMDEIRAAIEVVGVDELLLITLPAHIPAIPKSSI